LTKVSGWTKNRAAKSSQGHRRGRGSSCNSSEEQGEPRLRRRPDGDAVRFTTLRRSGLDQDLDGTFDEDGGSIHVSSGMWMGPKNGSNGVSGRTWVRIRGPLGATVDSRPFGVEDRPEPFGARVDTRTGGDARKRGSSSEAGSTRALGTHGNVGLSRTAGSRSIRLSGGARSKPSRGCESLRTEQIGVVANLVSSGRAR
jgi:hypothetical protein